MEAQIAHGVSRRGYFAPLAWPARALAGLWTRHSLPPAPIAPISEVAAPTLEQQADEFANFYLAALAANLKSATESAAVRKAEEAAALDKISRGEPVWYPGKDRYFEPQLEFMKSMGSASPESLRAQYLCTVALEGVSKVWFNRNGFLYLKTTPLISHGSGRPFNWGAYELAIQIGCREIWVQDAEGACLDHNRYVHPRLEWSSSANMGDVPKDQSYQELLRRHDLCEATSLILGQVLDPTLGQGQLSQAVFYVGS